jgi:hypothetical protein
MNSQRGMKSVSTRATMELDMLMGNRDSTIDFEFALHVTELTTSVPFLISGYGLNRYQVQVLEDLPE